MKTIMRIMPFLVLIGIIVFVLVLKGIEEDAQNERQNRETSMVILKESTKADESPPVVSNWVKKEVSGLDSSIKKLVDDLEPGVFQFDNNLIVIKPEKDKAYEMIRREVDLYEVRLIMREVNGEKNGELVVGEMSISKEVPIGVYDENGQYLF
ncbi:hypothetical protein ACOMCU_00175 [Lysinibacillus sp. UGB7]|uniref:hypothetical protein n=1 Tax=Lysinibacillus sp. UGB7 TaxID=3411039 RepID=UPI003B7D09C9